MRAYRKVGGTAGVDDEGLVIGLDGVVELDGLRTSYDARVRSLQANQRLDALPTVSLLDLLLLVSPVFISEYAEFRLGISGDVAYLLRREARLVGNGYSPSCPNTEYRA
jgi:hypothetical protein